MIIGPCPWCNEINMTEIAPTEYLPCYGDRDCDHCGKTYWILHTRTIPEAYKEKPENCGERMNNE